MLIYECNMNVYHIHRHMSHIAVHSDIPLGQTLGSTLFVLELNFFQYTNSTEKTLAKRSRLPEDNVGKIPYLFLLIQMNQN